MHTKEAKDFLVQQVAEQAALERVPLSDLEKRMLYFVENDPTSCENPLELNDEFDANYDTPEYEAKIARLLSDAYKRLKTDDPQRVVIWDSAMRLLSGGDHYLPVMWRGKLPRINRTPSSGSKVVKCGSIAMATFMLGGYIAVDTKAPSWIGAAFVMAGFFLCLLTLCFLAQQGYRALRRKFGKQPN